MVFESDMIVIVHIDTKGGIVVSSERRAYKTGYFSYFWKYSTKYFGFTEFIENLCL